MSPRSYLLTSSLSLSPSLSLPPYLSPSLSLSPILLSRGLLFYLFPLRLHFYIFLKIVVFLFILTKISNFNIASIGYKNTILNKLFKDFYTLFYLETKPTHALTTDQLLFYVWVSFLLAIYKIDNEAVLNFISIFSKTSYIEYVRTNYLSFYPCYPKDR